MQVYMTKDILKGVWKMYHNIYIYIMRVDEIKHSDTEYCIELKSNVHLFTLT